MNPTPSIYEILEMVKEHRERLESMSPWERADYEFYQELLRRYEPIGMIR